ncbi:hypothetical protein COCON_G00018970 [Conger conger]|uniref:Uncharacterized protein n=1 Tax=Conger conger TaxID=82655 RepID=A0A9Q1E444_CONCO|nr:hypothetical protein COCON_G00018970 [Conger conger]
MTVPTHTQDLLHDVDNPPLTLKLGCFESGRQQPVRGDRGNNADTDPPGYIQWKTSVSSEPPLANQ